MRIHVEEVEESAESVDEHRYRVKQALVAAGLSLPREHPPKPSPISNERREELAQKFSADQPLSELIREERDER